MNLAAQDALDALDNIAAIFTRRLNAKDLIDASSSAGDGRSLMPIVRSPHIAMIVSVIFCALHDNSELSGAYDMHVEKQWEDPTSGVETATSARLLALHICAAHFTEQTGVRAVPVVHCRTASVHFLRWSCQR
jgi:hypothetical protein